jgi:hypothetical protein
MKYLQRRRPHEYYRRLPNRRRRLHRRLHNLFQNYFQLSLNLKNLRQNRQNHQLELLVVTYHQLLKLLFRQG